jgi:hypothetical protein
MAETMWYREKRRLDLNASRHKYFKPFSFYKINTKHDGILKIFNFKIQISCIVRKLSWKNYNYHTCHHLVAAP